jgi:hypothetical protein
MESQPFLRFKIMKNEVEDLRPARQWLGHSNMEWTVRYLRSSPSQRVQKKVSEIFSFEAKQVLWKSGEFCAFILYRQQERLNRSTLSLRLSLSSRRGEPAMRFAQAGANQLFVASVARELECSSQRTKSLSQGSY